MTGCLKDLIRKAQQGSAHHQCELGWYYHKGRYGVPRNAKAALKWYTKAAEQGYAIAQSNLGEMYRHGDGIPQDNAAAFHWFTKAAEQGGIIACLGLGNMYRYGEGAPKDYILTYMWFNLVADKNEDAVEGRDLIAKKMTSSQIEVAQLATDWMKNDKPS